MPPRRPPRALDRPSRPRSARPGRRARSGPRSRSRSGRTPCGAARRRRGSSSCPRRSRRRARPAAARRSPAAPRRRRPRCRAGGARATRRRAIGSPPCSPLGVDLDLGPHPLEDREQAGPGRVDADLLEHHLAARRRAARRRRRRRPRRGRRGRRSRPASSRSAGRTTTVSPSRRTIGAGGGQHPLAVVAARQRLDDPRLALGEQAGEEQAGLDLGAGDRQLVARSRAAARRGSRSGGSRSSRRSGRRPSRRSGTATRSTGRRRIESSPSSVHSPPSCPASQPGSSRSRVPALPTSIAAGGPAQADAPRSADCGPGIALDPRPERRDRGQGRARVGGVEVALDPRLPLPHRRDQRRAVGDRLVRGRAQGAAQGPDGTKRVIVARPYRKATPGRAR